MNREPESPGHGETTRFRRHELKFVLGAGEIEQVKAWAERKLVKDVHAGSGSSYLVHSLYLDSPSLDLYHRTAGMDGTKFRIRRYADEPTIWLERKTRKGSVVRKRREACPIDQLEALLSSRVDASGWVGEFQKQIKSLQLAPRVLISYTRLAWNLGANARLTVDTRIEARRPDLAEPFSRKAAPYLLAQDAVLEEKFDRTLPELFRELLGELHRDPGSFSKYGRGLEAVGLAIVGRGIAEGRHSGGIDRAASGETPQNPAC